MDYLEFVAKFACSFLEKDETPKKDADDPDNETANAASAEEKEEEELPLFIYRLFAWLLDHHKVEGGLH